MEFINVRVTVVSIAVRGVSVFFLLVHAAAATSVGLASAASAVPRQRPAAFQDGPVTGAATQVALETLLHLAHAGQLLFDGAVAPEQRVHRHDESGRAESALGSVSFGQSLLDGVQASPLARSVISTASDAFHRRDGHPVQSADRREASVDRVVPVVDMNQIIMIRRRRNATYKMVRVGRS